MNNNKIAKLGAKKIFRPTKNGLDRAVQLLVEELVLPKGVDEYSVDELEKYILQALSQIKK